MKSDEVRITPAISPLRGQQRLYFLLGMLLLWPALVLGDVFAFNDTISYLRGADTLAYKFFGDHHPFFAVPMMSGVEVMPSSADVGHSMVLYGRSIYFGLFLYSGLLASSLWVPVVAQALAAGALIVALVRHFVDPADQSAFRRACLITFAVAACTPLPFFVCYLMPDLAVGLALPAMALLLVGWERERLIWRYILFALCVFAALAHSTAVALFLLSGSLALLVAWKTRSAYVAIPAALVLLAGLGGLAGEAVFGAATRITTGAAPVRPPFLTARLIEDGPARRYLAEHCVPDSVFTLCRYPIVGTVSAETFLWDANRPQGGFKALPVADAVAVSKEQFRFALAVAGAYPAETASGLARGVAHLATNLSMEEFRPEFTGKRMRADVLFEAVPSGVPLPLMLRVVPWLTGALLLAAIASLPWVARSHMMPDCKRIIFVVLAALIANDVICACLSGPFARYNTRGVWSFALVMLLFGLSCLQNRSAVSALRGAENPEGNDAA